MTEVAIKEPNDEDTNFSGSAAPRIVACGVSDSSGTHRREPRCAAGLRDRPRGRRAILERCLHERPGPTPVWRADVGLWQPPRALAIQKRVLILTASPPATSFATAAPPACSA